MNKIYKYITSISKNVSVEGLTEIVNEYYNTYYSTTKMKPTDVKPSTYIVFDKENNDKDPKFNVNDQVRKQNYNSIFAKGYVLKKKFL